MFRISECDNTCFKTYELYNKKDSYAINFACSSGVKLRRSRECFTFVSWFLSPVGSLAFASGEYSSFSREALEWLTKYTRRKYVNRKILCTSEQCNVFVCLDIIELGLDSVGEKLLIRFIIIMLPCMSFCSFGCFPFEPRHEKSSILVSDLVRHKSGCTATEDG